MEFIYGLNRFLKYRIEKFSCFIVNDKFVLFIYLYCIVVGYLYKINYVVCLLVFLIVVM